MFNLFRKKEDIGSLTSSGEKIVRMRISQINSRNISWYVSDLEIKDNVVKYRVSNKITNEGKKYSASFINGDNIIENIEKRILQKRVERAVNEYIEELPKTDGKNWNIKKYYINFQRYTLEIKANFTRFINFVPIYRKLDIRNFKLAEKTEENDYLIIKDTININVSKINKIFIEELKKEGTYLEKLENETVEEMIKEQKNKEQILKTKSINDYVKKEKYHKRKAVLKFFGFGKKEKVKEVKKEEVSREEIENIQEEIDKMAEVHLEK